MIKAVSGISFKNDANKDINALINSPGKFSATSAPSAPQASAVDGTDSFDKEEKSNTALKVGGTLATLAAIWIGLGIAVGKGKLASWKADGVSTGWGAKLKNVVYQIGDSAKKAYDNTLGKWFGKKADDAADAAKAKKADAPKADSPKADNAAE